MNDKYTIVETDRLFIFEYDGRSFLYSGGKVEFYHDSQYATYTWHKIDQFVFPASFNNTYVIDILVYERWFILNRGP